MAKQIHQDGALVLRFGGGVHSRATEDDIEDTECMDGKNFLLDPKDRSYRNRPPFDLLATAPNAGQINGFVSLLKSDGTVAMAVQAGDKVYPWTGSAFGSSIATVSSSARLRGRLEHNEQLANKVIVTDIALSQPVMEWDGTTFQNISFTKNDPPVSFGTFKARYCVVDNERAWYANVNEPGGTFPHLIVGSKRGDYAHISVADRPSSSLSPEDPFYLVQPDLYTINGMVSAYDTLITSSAKGSLFKLEGLSAEDYSIAPFYPRSGASGAESVTYIGNDVLYGRQGRIESLVATDKYGDVETDDVSFPIANRMEDVDGWTIVYNSRLQRAYCFPTDGAYIWVLFKSMLATGLSPWARWYTSHSMAFQPTAVMNCLDPADGLEYVFMGDANGKLYRLEGTGLAGDAGTNPVEFSRLSKLFSGIIGTNIYNVEGWIKYRPTEQITLNVVLNYQGERIFDSIATITLDPSVDGVYYGGDAYYGGDYYYGTRFRARIDRSKFTVPAGSTDFQITIEGETVARFEILEIGIRLEQAG